MVREAKTMQSGGRPPGPHRASLAALVREAAPGLGGESTGGLGPLGKAGCPRHPCSVPEYLCPSDMRWVTPSVSPRPHPGPSPSSRTQSRAIGALQRSALCKRTTENLLNQN